MASNDLLQMEDQTDEDFFDKLVADDEFGLTGSAPASGDMVRALSSVSLGEGGSSVDNLEAEDKQGDEKVLVSDFHEKADTIKVESIVAEGTNYISEDAQSINIVKTTMEMELPGTSAEKNTGFKGTSVKVVQWTSFSSDQVERDVSGLGMDSDFYGVPDGSAANLLMDIDDKSTVLNTTFGPIEPQDDQALGVTGEQPIYFTSSNQSDSQAYGAFNDQAAAGDECQYWENAYPGWKYDVNTGQWYQVDGCGTATNAQADGYVSSVMGHQESLHESSGLAGDSVISDQQSEILYLNQTTPSVVETVSDGYATGNVSSWSQVSQGKTEYPSNMVFDPQYPGWYYDTDTLEWYSLESYTQSLETTTNTVQNQLTQEVGSSTNQDHSLYNGEVGQLQTKILDSRSTQEQADWGRHIRSYHQPNIWQPAKDVKNETAFANLAMAGSFYNSPNTERSYFDQQPGVQSIENAQVSQSSSISNYGVTSFSAFVPAQSSYQFSQPSVEQQQHSNVVQNSYLNQNSANYSQQFSLNDSMSLSHFSYAPNRGRKLEGRPPHALVTFGFGGKLIVMKYATSFGANVAYVSQEDTSSEISVLNLVEIFMEKDDSSSFANQNCNYFYSLCKQSFPGPLVGGSAATKDLNKWIDERITSCESSSTDFRKGEHSKLLLSLLKISCQHYGKLRSPFGVDPSLQEIDSPELAVTRLFASARKNGDHLREYGTFTHCMHNLPSEQQLRKTAVEVQNLLVSGRRKEALQCAQEGQLWGLALVLAAQLGDKFYVDSVKQMAHHQFLSGSPLRTLCLLIAGQPADVFSTNINISAGVVNVQRPTQVSAGGLLDDWEENVAIITTNRTKDDELVIINLGDCLWKERGEVTAAHTCYLVAEAKFEPYSDKARLCLVGADHWKCPRTYASPEAIQRTELYEYSKVLGNSQFILLPFQPYKFVYACMLAEVGKVSDSLKYCQAILKSLKNAGRDPEVETLKWLVSSLEERLRAHQQGGYSTNLAPSKLVGKLFTSIDRSLHRMIGAPPPSLPPIPPSNLHSNEYDNMLAVPRIENSQSPMGMSSLPPSASVETISEWTGDSRKIMQNRSISEPDFGRSPKQGQMNPSTDASSTNMQNKASGASRIGHFGSQFFQKTMGWMSRSRQAKLGETNKFYYDEKLKRWVEEGAETPAEEAALPPPPTTASFQKHAPEPNIDNAFSTENSMPNGFLETKTSNTSEHSPGIPPVPPAQNQFSARSRLGVRSRYVDTFNKGGGMATGSFQSPSVPSIKPIGGAMFFVPSPVASSDSVADSVESNQVASSTEGASTSANKEFSASPSSSSSSAMQRFPSMDNISNRNRRAITPSQHGNISGTRTRAASWSGSYSDAFNLQSPDLKHSGGGFSPPSAFTTNNPSPLRPAGKLLHPAGSSISDDLHEVEL